jgi:hypothetical protein
MPDFGSIPISEITRRRILAARRGAGGSRRTGKALTDTTLRVRLPTLKLILDYAVEERLIPTNPMVGGPRLWRSAPQPETIDPFTSRELRGILEAAGAINRDFATLLRVWVQAGMRSGEVRGSSAGTWTSSAAWPTCSAPAACAGWARPRPGDHAWCRSSIRSATTGPPGSRGRRRAAARSSTGSAT